MRLAAVSFTAAGSRLCGELVRALGREGDHCRGWTMKRFLQSGCGESGLSPLNTSLEVWTREHFLTSEGLIFIGAAGIAVRAVAPYIQNKWSDPAVVAMDESGRYVIPLLSGHLGGANDLARRIARITGAEAVITTATDRRGIFAVDEFARKRGMAVSDMNKAKAVSAALLAGEPVGFFCDFPVTGDLPAGLAWEKVCERNIWITVSTGEAGDKSPLSLRFAGCGKETLRLFPRVTVLGIGCRRGTTEEAIAESVSRALLTHHIAPESVAAVATIDLKKEERGLVSFASGRRAEFLTYPAGRLAGAAGEFTSSEFVRRRTGVDNVCERAALLAASEGCCGALIMRKQAACGVTVAAAVRNRSVVL